MGLLSSGHGSVRIRGTLVSCTGRVGGLPGGPSPPEHLRTQQLGHTDHDKRGQRDHAYRQNYALAEERQRPPTTKRATATPATDRCPIAGRRTGRSSTAGTCSSNLPLRTSPKSSTSAGTRTMSPSGDRDQQSNQRGVARGRGVDRQPRQDVGALSDAPSGDDRSDRQRRGDARRPVACRADQRERHAPCAGGHEQRDQPRTARQVVEQRASIRSQHEQAGDGERARDQPHHQRPHLERARQFVVGRARRIAGEVNRCEVSGGRDGEGTDRDRGRVQPARR